MAESQWETIRSEGLEQGDFISNCFVPVYDEEIAVALQRGDEDSPVGFDSVDVVVLSQSCDLARLDYAITCRAYGIPQLHALNSSLTSKTFLSDAVAGRRPQFHVLGGQAKPDDPFDSLVVDFRQVFSVPIRYLREHAKGLGERYRLRPPFREKFAQSAGLFIMRVATPGDPIRFPSGYEPPKGS